MATEANGMDLKYNDDGLLWDAAFPDNHNILGVLPLDYAQLFAAAPELLAACKLAFSQFQQSPLNADDDWILSPLAQQLKLAIRKATKGTP